MIRTLVDIATKHEWVDVTDPTEKELQDLAVKYNLSTTATHDCLDANHLPSYEEGEDADFILIRYADENTYNDVDADTIPELTRKIALFSGPNFLLSIHRTEPKFLGALFAKWNKPGRELQGFLPLVLQDLLRAGLVSYGIPLGAAEGVFEEQEAQIFNKLATEKIIEDIYFLKRKVSVYRRMIRQTLDVILSARVAGLQDEGNHLFLFADELNDDLNHLLNTHLSLASHRANEIVRVLTLFSVFFMPLTFLVGVYGMNFQFMPELKWKWGYPAVWGLMLATSLAIFAWFRQKGWIRSRRRAVTDGNAN